MSKSEYDRHLKLEQQIARAEIQMQEVTKLLSELDRFVSELDLVAHTVYTSLNCGEQHAD